MGTPNGEIATTPAIAAADRAASGRLPAWAAARLESDGHFPTGESPVGTPRGGGAAPRTPGTGGTSRGLSRPGSVSKERAASLRARAAPAPSPSVAFRTGLAGGSSPAGPRVITPSSSVRRAGRAPAGTPGTAASGTGPSASAPGGTGRTADALPGGSGAAPASAESGLLAIFAFGGDLDLQGRTMHLHDALVVEAGAPRVVRIRNGVLVAGGVAGARGAGAVGNGYALAVRGEGLTLHLTNIKTVGTGLRCDGGASLILDEGCVVSEAPRSGIMVHGRGHTSGAASSLVMTGGRVEARELNGVCCAEGGGANLEGVELVECRLAGILATGAGSRVSARGGAVRGVSSVLSGAGAVAQHGGAIDLKDVSIDSCQDAAVVAMDAGSTLAAEACRLTGVVAGHGASCTRGGSLALTGTTIDGSRRCGVWAAGTGSTCALDGCRVVDSGASAVAVGGGAMCRVSGGTVLRGAGRSVAACSGTGTRLEIDGGEVSLSRAGHGVAASEGAQAGLVGVRVDTVHRTGVLAGGSGTLVAVDGGGVQGCGEHGLACAGGARLVARRLDVVAVQGAGCVVGGAGAAAQLHRVSIGGPPREGHGLVVKAGGAASLEHCRLDGGRLGGLVASGDGSRARLASCEVMGADLGHGVHAENGARIELIGAAVLASGEAGVVVEGPGAMVRLETTVIDGAARGHCIAVVDGGRADVVKSHLLNAQLSVLFVAGPGSVADVLGGILQGARENHGCCLRDKAHVRLDKVEIRECAQNGVFRQTGDECRAVLQGCSIGKCGWGETYGC